MKNSFVGIGSDPGVAGLWIFEKWERDKSDYRGKLGWLAHHKRPRVAIATYVFRQSELDDTVCQIGSKTEQLFLSCMETRVKIEIVAVDPRAIIRVS